MRPESSGDILGVPPLSCTTHGSRLDHFIGGAWHIGPEPLSKKHKENKFFSYRRTRNSPLKAQAGEAYCRAKTHICFALVEALYKGCNHTIALLA